MANNRVIYTDSLYTSGIAELEQAADFIDAMCETQPMRRRADSLREHEESEPENA
jgi:hypothetical protein